MSLLKQTMLPLCAMILLSPLSIQASSSFKPEYGSAEHVFLGDKVRIPFLATTPEQPIPKLNLPNGMTMTYGEILSFGDFYGVNPISLGKTEQERRVRFLAAFNSFAENPNVIPEANQILGVIHDEVKLVDEAIKNGEPTEAVYKRLGHEFDIKFNCITGGGCTKLDWLINQGRYLQLAKYDFDHFGENAWIAYKIGHELALEQAALAHSTSDYRKLEVAYAMNAFASHFLSDRFAAGHIRTPRQELNEQVTPSVVGAALANFMHDEENMMGLHVHNVRGDHWIAYGDKSYFNPKNLRNKEIIEETMQVSADQIYAAFQQGTIPASDNTYTLLPQADELENAGRVDISPLFYWDSKSRQLLQRKDLGNFYDRHWTSYWVGAATLLKLQVARGSLSEKTQATLALSEYGEEALKEGLITNKELVAYVKKRKA